jgi:Xaa-Pro aminopeptidase
VTAVMLFADTLRSADMRHVVPRPMPDPIFYVEHNGERHVLTRSFEVPHLSELPGIRAHAWDEFGLSELINKGLEQIEATWEISARFAVELGLNRAAVPPDFPLEVADRLRAVGVDLEVDRKFFADRRRPKGPVELAGIRRACAAAEAATRAVARVLARAEVTNGSVLADGKPVTSERLKQEVMFAVIEHGAAINEFIVAHGPQTSVGTLGSGPILAGEPITVDLWPWDIETGCYTDMTRTFVVGTVSEELAEYHSLCRAALDACLGVIRPGLPVGELYGVAAEIIEGAGYPTMRTKKEGEVLRDGFFHTLGHGVGLDVHEQPWLNLSADQKLRASDVIAIEPGCYRHGYGGVRLEDLIHVTEEGAEDLVDFPYELDPSVAAD